MREAIVTQVTFILKIKLEGSVLLKYDHFLKRYCGFFEPPVRMGICIRMPRLKD